ncbi:MAG: hypothetical protein IPJ55_07535 [Chloracidobacterium sp.]|nr:hypothetical protein [Chloracidobacterium sp.]
MRLLTADADGKQLTDQQQAIIGLLERKRRRDALYRTCWNRRMSVRPLSIHSPNVAS